MTMKKITKIVVALLVALLVVTACTQFVSAASVDLSQFDDHTNDSSNASSTVTNIIGSIIYIARIVGAGVAIIMLIVLAIQYIAASPSGKAEIRKNATIYIVGAIILFASSAILGIIQNFATQNVGEG